ncbi:MAG: aminotransferase class III-fold pyridoxal phosphate-dependent enzyme [Dehalococcoidales bacterium]|nr:aminotransferase class III-fold pyridoxal phosphate-dependent enzyme [Dehalococcoidales bacterium]
MQTRTPRTSVEEIKQFDKNHVLHSWSVQSKIKPLLIVGGEGCYMIDAAGTRYLDLYSQLNYLNLGYQHPRLVEAIKRQAERLCVVSPAYANEPAAVLARLLSEVAPGDLDRTFFTLGGADAVENAVKMARLFTGRHKIITRYRSYHGATFGAITLSGDPRRPPVEPGISGVVRALDCYCYRCPFGQSYPGCGLGCAEHIDTLINFEGPGQVAAVLVEPIVGSNGVLVPPPEYLPRLRDICDRYGVLLIADEVMSGWGRAGQWFAVQNWNVVPDIIVTAKGLTGGYLPLGAVIVNARLAQHFEDNFLWCGLTYSMHPLCCAAGVAAVEIYRDEGIIERSQRLGELLMAGLQGLKEKHRSIGDVRGKGLFTGLELVKDRHTREPLVPWNASAAQMAPVQEVQRRLHERRVLPFIRWNSIFVSPPLVVSEAELEEAIAALDYALEAADALVA